MGYTARTDTYRYTEWVGFDPVEGKPDWNNNYGEELYQYDPKVTTSGFDDDNVNLAKEVEFRDTVLKLRKILRAGWRHALPPQYQVGVDGVIPNTKGELV